MTVVFNRLPLMRRKLPLAVDAVLGKAAHDFVGQVQNVITAKGLIDTGNYLNSWFARRVSLGNVIVWIAGSNVEYGPHLNYGTIHMAARPHVEPTFSQVAPAIIRNLRTLTRLL